MALPDGLAVAVQAGSHDAQDGDNEQDGEGYIGTDEGGGEDRDQDSEGGRGGLGQRGEEAGEGREHEDGEAKCPDTGAGMSVGHASPPASDRLHGRYRAYTPLPSRP
jgi:hypothetical protein